MKLTVEEIYDRLVNDDKILTKKGRITFTLGDIDIIVRQRDVVGNIMQEWVEGWLKKNDIEYALNDNTRNHSIFRHDNFIGCFSADKIKMSARK